MAAQWTMRGSPAGNLDPWRGRTRGLGCPRRQLGASGGICPPPQRRLGQMYLNISLFASPVVLVIAPVEREQARSASPRLAATIGRLVAAHTPKQRGPGRRGRRGSLSRWQDGREPPSERASAAPRCRRQPSGPSGPGDASRSPRRGAAPVSAAHSDPTSPRRPAPEVRRCRRPGRTAAAQAHAKGPQTHTTRQKNAPEPPTAKYSRTNKFGPRPRITPQNAPAATLNVHPTQVRNARSCDAAVPDGRRHAEHEDSRRAGDGGRGARRRGARPRRLGRATTRGAGFGG